MQILVDLAAQFDRRVAFVGRGCHRELGDRAAARIPADPGRRADSRQRGAQLPRRRTSCASAPGRRESRRRRSRGLRSTTTGTSSSSPDDVVVFSAREIPGNEKAIGRVMNHIARRGAEVIYEGIKHVHVSGHGSEEELKLMLSLVRPRYFVPIHGEYRQLARHARIAARVSAGTKVLLAENGDVIRFDDEGGRLAGQGAGGPDPDRRHAERRGRRRGPARPPAPGRGRPGRAGRRDRPAVRERSRRRRT